MNMNLMNTLVRLKIFMMLHMESLTDHKNQIGGK